MSYEQDSGRSQYVYPAVLAGIIIFLVILPLLVNMLAPHPVGEVYETPERVADFALPRADGGTFRLSDWGKTVVLYFGYTSCPDVCPTTLADLKRARAELGEYAEGVESSL